ncbi:hypothetical protein BUALT_Bualt13G0078400 [Buddleja alternifolia]|uniref:Potassium transporter n=1 Tax=Buddleja alternifolia TaxID=168488 RepID=A0AAV6WWL0_9LAMI|nr:hypothetical protein BUALT_Bualt13G0078400 [Buddleja alternifolia]
MSTSTEHEESTIVSEEEKPQEQLNGEELHSDNKLTRYDSMDIESGKLGRRYHHGGAATKSGEWAVVLQLAFQSLGVVYGDIGTSPLYVYASTFTDGIKHNDDILGVLSLIFYTITLIPLIKFVFIVLRANDHGDGGTFALYSLICRYAKVGLMPSQEIEDQDVSTFQLELPNNRIRIASKLQTKLENSNFAKYFLLFATMLGTSMVIGDGVLTPCISVLSAVGGIKESASFMTEGTEALFADVGHFSVRSIQISMCTVTYPALIFAYTGQGSFLRKNNHLVADTFYKSIPGIAVVFVMTLTSAFLVLIMIMTWKTHILLIISYVLIIGTIEIVYLSSVLYKFDQGGYLPLAFALILMSIMYVWNDLYRKKYYFELDHKISHEKVKKIVEDTNTQRLPGLAVFYSELVHGIPPIFKHYIANEPAPHSVLIFISFKSLPISKVPIEERFLFRRVQPKDLQVFRCVVRYGYKDVHKKQEPFERLLIEKLKEFIMEDYHIGSEMTCTNVDEVQNEGETVEDVVQCENELVSVEREEAIERDVEYVDKACRNGVVHLVGEHEVVAAKGANIGKRVLIDYAYNFLKKNLRQSNKVFDIPHQRMLKVGMTYEL